MDRYGNDLPSWVTTVEANEEYCRLQDQKKKDEEAAARKRIEEQNAPLIENLQELTAQTRKQNEPVIANLQELIAKTQEQNRLLQEENERQKQEVAHAREQELIALEETKRAHIHTWIAHGFSVIMAIIAIIALFVR